MSEWKQCEYNGPLAGQQASQGRERQPSQAAHSIWMTLFNKLCLVCPSNIIIHNNINIIHIIILYITSNQLGYNRHTKFHFGRAVFNTHTHFFYIDVHICD